MSEKPSEAPIKFPQASVVKALFVANNKAKEETASINGTYGDRIKTQIEVGNLHGPSFRHAASIFRKAQNNELKAKEHVAHLRFLLDLLDEELENAGHVGDLDRMSKAAAKDDEDEGDEPGEPDPNLNTAPGGLPHDESLARFEANLSKSANLAKAGKALDLPALTEAAAKPKRSSKKAPATPEAKLADKYLAAQEQRLGKLDETPPPSDGEEDLRPAFLRRKDEEREAAVH